MSSQQNDIVLCSFGQSYDWVEIDPECGYVVDTLEPFRDINANKQSKLAKKKLQITDDSGTQHTARITDIITAHLKIYYHDKPLNFDLDKYPGKRAPGLINSLLDEIELIVTENNLQ